MLDKSITWGFDCEFAYLFASYIHFNQGAKLEQHPLKKEMERIQMYMRKVKVLESTLKGVRPPTGHNPPTHQTVDKFAAARFIKRGLGQVISISCPF